MTAITSLEDIYALRESVELECKLAQGKNGKGKIPDDFWPSYSAFANTNGGIIVLGLKEKSGKFELAGVEDVDKVLTELFNTANSGKVNINLLADSNCKKTSIDGKNIIVINIPRASRKERPVYLKGNPLGNTYRRLHESDQRMSDEQVKRMLAEQLEDARDNKILPYFGMDDLDLETLQTYRQNYANLNPGAPWNELDNVSFLRRIGAYKVNRETGEQGLTAAGLLMFGRHPEIQEEFPFFMLDYQERPEAKTERRWVDRVTLDGTWSGNLYDFYRKVYRKLISDLKIPFELKEGLRQEDTPVHQALREALANVLVHADFSQRASVLVVKRPDMFGFRNPGLMRIPIEAAIHGGESDCRNRILHQMFRYVNVGEQAGSGIPKILAGWKSQHWRSPLIREASQPYDQTLLELRMLDLFPEGIVDLLCSVYEDEYTSRTHIEQVAMAVAFSEGCINNARLAELTNEHTADVSKCLRALTAAGIFEIDGIGRGATYHLAGLSAPRPEDVFDTPPTLPNGILSLNKGSSQNCDDSSPLNEANSPLNDTNSPINEPSSLINKNKGEDRDEFGRMISPLLDKPVIDSMSYISSELLERLREIADKPRHKQRIKPDTMESILVRVLTGHFMRLDCLAELMNRKPDSLRDNYLSRMVKDGRLEMAFPQQPNDPRQAYSYHEKN